jgi:hypothetical protein
MKIEQNYWSQLAGAPREYARMQRSDDASESRAAKGPTPANTTPPPPPAETASAETTPTQVAGVYQDPRHHGLALGRFNRMLMPLLRQLEQVAEKLTGTKLSAQPISNEQAARGSTPAGSLIQSAQFSISTESTRLDIQTEDGRLRYDGRSLTATGLIRTADGKELSFSFSAEFDRLRFREGSENTLEKGEHHRENGDHEEDQGGPRVLHYEGTAMELRRQSFSLQWSLSVPGIGSGNSTGTAAIPATSGTDTSEATNAAASTGAVNDFVNDSTADPLQRFNVSP